MTLRPTLNRSHLAQPMEADAARDILNALTIDVEDYYHVSAFETHVPRSRWGDYESRVLRNTHRILALWRSAIHISSARSTTVATRSAPIVTGTD